MNGDHLQNGGSAVLELNGKEGGRPCLMNGLHESDQSDDAYEKPGTKVRIAMSPHHAYTQSCWMERPPRTLGFVYLVSDLTFLR